MKDKTGIFTFEEVKNDLIDFIHQDNLKCVLRGQAGRQLLLLQEDGREYVIQHEWQENNESIQLIIKVVLFNPTDAQIGEYASLGPAERYLKNYNSFILLSDDYLFVKDEVGWKRVEMNESEVNEIHERVRSLQDDGSTTTE